MLKDAGTLYFRFIFYHFQVITNTELNTIVSISTRKTKVLHIALFRSCAQDDASTITTSIALFTTT